MNLATVDIVIIFFYIAASIGLGLWISKKATASMRSYFLGGNKLPWYALGLSNASGMFDISGTMWMVYLLFIYGLKSVYIPWLWPVFNQIFLMVFLSLWLRRSGAMTGADWISFRFGTGTGSSIAHMIVVAFALLNVLGFIAYGFIGAGKFAAVFLPWKLSADPHTNELIYGLTITLLTTVYVVKGGMFSVVFTEILQFFVMTVACIAVGVIAMQRVSPEMLAAVTPEGWTDLSFGWQLGLDWTAILSVANEKIINDGWSFFSIFFMLMLFKGVLQSLAGPLPNYDMQRILSAKTPVEAAKMSWIVNVVLLFPRYMFVAGLTVLALVFFMDELRAMNSTVDFELILPFALKNFIPAGLLGLTIAGLLAAFMSTFAATVNAAPAYVVNDIYKKYLNKKADEKVYVKMSYIVSVAFVLLGTLIGLYLPSLNEIVLWIVGALYGGYAASNVLKWYWWRLNGFGYFYGMLAGIVVAVPMMFFDLSPIHAFPVVLIICFIACVVGSLLTPPDDMEVLKNFYLKTRPWGFWQPVYQALLHEYPDLEKNTEFGRDAINVVVGIIWQTAITAAAIFMVIQYWQSFISALVVIVLTSIFLKLNWYDKLKNYPQERGDKTVSSVAS